jgi:hypothetical protein
MWMPEPALNATAIGQPEPRDRLILAWLFFEAGARAEAANASDAKCRQTGRARRGAPQRKAIISRGAGKALPLLRLGRQQSGSNGVEISTMVLTMTMLGLLAFVHDQFPRPHKDCRRNEPGDGEATGGTG